MRTVSYFQHPRRLVADDRQTDAVPGQLAARRPESFQGTHNQVDQSYCATTPVAGRYDGPIDCRECGFAAASVFFIVFE